MHIMDLGALILTKYTDFSHFWAQNEGPQAKNSLKLPKKKMIIFFYQINGARIEL
jgi:hypothetical protein